MPLLRLTRNFFCSWLLGAATVTAASENPMTAPDTVGSYQGLADERKILGSVEVKEPPIGYFVAGSSVRELNGPYGRLRVADMEFPAKWSSKVQLAYENLRTGWHLVKAAAPEAADRGPDDNGLEWLFVDDSWTPRFMSENASAVCMAGLEFRHHPDDLVAELKVGYKDELPWQVTAVLKSDAMDRVLADLAWHEKSVNATIAGKGLPPLPDVGEGPALEGEDPPDEAWAVALRSAGVDVQSACAPESAALVESVLVALELTANDVPWAAAPIHLAVARCLRRGRNLTAAESSVTAALEIKPRFKEALFERGLLLMDAGRYGDAIRAFQTVLRVDRAWPGLDMWLVRAHGQVRRREIARRAPILVQPGEEPQGPCDSDWCSDDRYIALGVRCDVPSTEEDGSEGKELKKAYKQRSLEVHPDRKPAGDEASGTSSNRAFQRVAEVYAILSDVERRVAYDAGEDIPRMKQKDGTVSGTHRQLVERKYFPERFGFEPFGDPLQDRRSQEHRTAAKREHSRQEDLASAAADKRDEL